jgi:hypothetical protein
MIFKNKIPATSIRQKHFSKLSQVTHIKVVILNKFYKLVLGMPSLDLRLVRVNKDSNRL